MSNSINGIHHVSMISGEIQPNIDFYVGVLGLRLVKQTINYDDPSMFHLYYGNEAGDVGTLLTFFPSPGGYAGRQGPGQAAAISLLIPEGSIDFWIDRFAKEVVSFDMPTERFGQKVLPFKDPDGLPLELVEDIRTEGLTYWEQGPIEGRNAIRGVHSVTLNEANPEVTETLLTQELGFAFVGEDGDRKRFQSGEGAFSYLDVISDTRSHGRVAVGSMHHVAFSVKDREAQEYWRQKVEKIGLRSSPIMDRDYFTSIYFREPGGVLFELATEAPGMGIDEPIETLGSQLQVPDWVQPDFKLIAARLPKLNVPTFGDRS